MAAKRARTEASAENEVVIKKYANRRLYNTSTSSYVTLDDLRKMVQQDIAFRVIDAKSAEDLTRAVLTQIIVEEESRGQNLLPISFLRQIISLYEDNMRWTLPQYLETVMGWYGRNQHELQKKVSTSMSGVLPPGLEEMQRNQMALFDQAMRMFNPMAKAGQQPESTKPEPNRQPDQDEINGLREQIAALQQAVDRLAQKKD